jgi:hypothetical protein
MPYGTTGGQVITRNTIENTGRSAIDFGPVMFGQHLNMEISYNDIFHWGALSADGGAVYGGRYIDLTGTVIHHNWIHDSKAQVTPAAEYEVGINAGLYFDQAVGPTTDHHNVLWNNYQCDVHNASWDPQRAAGKSYFYNNVLATDAGDDHTGTRSYLTITTEYFDVMRNNIFRDDVVINWITPSTDWGDVENCLMEDQRPSFLNTGDGGLSFRLAPGSDAIDAGVVVPGVTDGSIGTPDIGAYEQGGEDWVPGYSPVLP